MSTRGVCQTDGPVGGHDTDAEYIRGYDLHYLVNCSPVLDLEITARTIWVILARRL